jgi:CheY-like chemotaxis protein
VDSALAVVAAQLREKNISVLETFGGGCEVRSLEGHGTSFLVWFPCEISEKQTLEKFDKSVAIALLDARETHAASCLADHIASTVDVYSTADEVFRSKPFLDGTYLVTFVDDIEACIRHKVFSTHKSLICFITREPLHRLRRLELESYGIIPVSKPLTFDLLQSILAKAAPNPQPTTEPIEPPRTPLNLPGLNVMVVDDNETNIVVMKQMLKNVGVFEEVAIAHDGQEALDLLKSQPFDFVFMDIHMPNVSGWEAARNIRKYPQYFQKCGVIIALTAASTLQDREESLRYMDIFLCKPVQLDSLASVLNDSAHRIGLDRVFKRASHCQKRDSTHDVQFAAPSALSSPTPYAETGQKFPVYLKNVLLFVFYHAIRFRLLSVAIFVAVLSCMFWFFH